MNVNPWRRNRELVRENNVLRGIVDERGRALAELDRRNAELRRDLLAWRHPALLAASPDGHWLNRASTMLREEGLCSRGEPDSTSVDRRWLWRLEGFLAVNATNADQRLMGRDLHAYLNESCEHHWHSYEAEDGIDAHRQCLYCNDVVWTARVYRAIDRQADDPPEPLPDSWQELFNAQAAEEDSARRIGLWGAVEDPTGETP